MNQRIKYRAGYKYQLAETYQVAVPIFPSEPIASEFISLGRDGALTIAKGYAWNGPSGPAADTKNFMRGSLVHDALYQLMREGRLDAALWRDHADVLLRDMCVEDGMSKIRAWWVYTALQRFGSVAFDRAEILEAP